jgi:hypothetical protein
MWGRTFAPGLVAAVAIACVACAGSGGPDRCKIQVASVEQWSRSAEGLDAAFRVSGEAGSAGKTWLVAKTGDSQYVSGYGVDVGPGPFAAVVDLKLTGEPIEFLVLLEVAGRRCKAAAKKPS